MISKSTFLFMTSQVQLKRQVLHCNKDLERDKKYVAEISNPEMVAWIWCIAIAYLAPEIGTFIRSARICVFKSCRKPFFSDFLVVLLFESMHVVGMALLSFVVLPELDVVKGAMLTNCLAFIPAAFGKS